ncbi:hypothetical protein [Lunatimonas salinarum]|uniref:hypothetical protein n=1 Tax=Lunatimonas salinarum TaxID=1774590 RepID=UPI001ADEEAB9|nr:hypothetical protein [Lunatimonas salinarum]
MKFTEAKLEQVFTELLGNEGYPHFVGSSLVRSNEDEVLIEDDLKTGVARSGTGESSDFNNSSFCPLSGLSDKLLAFPSMAFRTFLA